MTHKVSELLVAWSTSVLSVAYPYCPTKLLLFTVPTVLKPLMVDLYGTQRYGNVPCASDDNFAEVCRDPNPMRSHVAFKM